MAGRLTDPERFEHVRAWKASGKTRYEYAKHNGVSPASLTIWNSRLLQKKTTPIGPSARAPKKFVELATASAPNVGGSIELQVGDVVVRLIPPVDIGTLTAVLAVLEGAR